MLGRIRRQLMHNHAHALCSRNGQVQRRAVKQDPFAYQASKMRELRVQKLQDGDTAPFDFASRSWLAARARTRSEKRLTNSS